MKPVNFVFAFVFLVSCNRNELTRDQAAELVTAHFEYPNVEVRNFELGNIMGNRLAELVADEVLYLNKRDVWQWKYTPTDLGEAYQSSDGKFATCKRVFNEVTGIKYETEDKLKAEIEFSVLRKEVTPFGRFINQGEGDTAVYTATAERYDDGWRITSDKGSNLKPENFGGVFSIGVVSDDQEISEEEAKDFLMAVDPHTFSNDSSILEWVIDFSYIIRPIEVVSFQKGEEATIGFEVMYQPPMTSGESIYKERDMWSLVLRKHRGKIQVIRARFGLSAEWEEVRPN